MSRSYKKNAYCTDGKGGKHGGLPTSKRFANKAIRNHKEKIANGGSYKKIFETWEIRDYKFYYPWSQAKQEFLNGQTPPRKTIKTLKDFYYWWKKYYKRK